MLMAKYLLTLVGLLYAYLSLWCSFYPATTSLKVGFERLGDSGRSEFLTVYGGLEMGLALLFLLPWLIPQSTLSVLWGCVLIHGSLVLFRTISLGLYPKVSTMTYQLAAAEWLILLLAIAALLWTYRTLPAAHS